MTTTLTIGKYRLIRELGRSNDVVYEAIDSTSGKKVALKVVELPPSLSGVERSQRIERFHREVRATSRLSHPNIVQIYETGQDRDRLFVAMEFLEGISLANLLKQKGRLDLEEAIEIGSQVCSALTYAHSREVIHRDVKPSNAMILRDGSVKITDFGIARIRGDPRMTLDGQTLGTPYYMSPEQVRGEDVTSASDIFSCAVVFYEMLVGRKPFEGSNIAEIGLKIVESEPDFPSDLPPHVITALKKALSKYPAARFATAEEFADAIRHLRAAIPAPAKTTPPPAPPAPKTLQPTFPLPQDWSPEQSQRAWQRAKIAALIIVLTIFSLCGPMIYREYQREQKLTYIGTELKKAAWLAEYHKWKDALRRSEKILNSTPADSPLAQEVREVWKQTRLAYAKWSLKQRQPSDALEELNAVLSRFPHEPEAHYLAGLAYLKLPDLESARKEFQSCLQLAPGTGIADAAQRELNKIYSRPNWISPSFPSWE